MKWIALISLLLTLSGCLFGGSDEAATPATSTTSETTSSSGSYNVRVSWTANRETMVNRSGGGYRVYYSKSSGFSTSSASSVDVPFSSGSAAPTETTLSSLAAGTWYVRVVAYSSYGSSSESSETSVTVP